MEAARGRAGRSAAIGAIRCQVRRAWAVVGAGRASKSTENASPDQARVVASKMYWRGAEVTYAGQSRRRSPCFHLHSGYRIAISSAQRRVIAATKVQLHHVRRGARSGRSDRDIPFWLCAPIQSSAASAALLPPPSPRRLFLYYGQTTEEIQGYMLSIGPHLPSPAALAQKMRLLATRARMITRHRRLGVSHASGKKVLRRTCLSPSSSPLSA